MGERSRRRVRDLVTQLAFEGLSENEIGRARISMIHVDAQHRDEDAFVAQLKSFGLNGVSSLRVRSARPMSLTSADLISH
jgi:hypothetical protein